MIDEEKLNRLKENYRVVYGHGKATGFVSYLPELFSTLEALWKVARAAEPALSVLEDLNDLDWEPNGRPFNWDEIQEKLEISLNELEGK